MFEVQLGVGISHPLNQTPFKGIHSQPADVKAFQAGLTRMLGVDNQTGRPWLRIVWAQDQGADEWGPIAKDWNDYGNGGRGEWRARYLYSSTPKLTIFTDPDSGLLTRREVWEDISPPRFCLERLIPPDVACLGWNIPTSNDAWVHHALTDEYIDQQGERYSPRKPHGGLYVPLEFDHPGKIVGGMIADHDSICCENAKKADEVCYGWYAEPAAEHLAIMEAAVSAIKKRKEKRPGIMTAEEQAESLKASREKRERYYGALENRLSRITLDALHTHAGLLSPDPSKQKWGSRAFVRECAHSKSGATPEEINRWRKEKSHGINGNSGAAAPDAAADNY